MAIFYCLLEVATERFFRLTFSKLLVFFNLSADASIVFASELTVSSVLILDSGFSNSYGKYFF